MADVIHDFTEFKFNLKNPSQELIVLWIAGAWSDISEKMIELSFCKRIKNMTLFSASPFFPTHSPKLWCILYTN